MALVGELSALKAEYEKEVGEPFPLPAAAGGKRGLGAGDPVGTRSKCRKLAAELDAASD